MNRKFEQSIKYIRDNFRQDIRLDDIAYQSNLSPFHFHRVFREVYNETPAMYLQRVRLEYAAHVLGLYPYKSVLEVAIESGFNSLQAFSRAFKNYFSVSPTEFRNKPITETVRFMRSYIYESGSPPIEVATRYMEEHYIYCRLTTIFPENITELFHQVSDEAVEMGLSEAPFQWIGVFMDTPLHTSSEKCQYYAGVKINSAPNQGIMKNSYLVPAGRYACFTYSGDIFALCNVLWQFKFEWLDKSSYEIKTPIGFEHVHFEENIPYTELKKTLFVPVQPKK